MIAKLLTAPCYYLNISMLLMVKGVNQLINVYSYFNLKGCQRSWPKPNRKKKQQHTNNQTEKTNKKHTKKIPKHTQKSKSFTTMISRPETALTDFISNLKGYTCRTSAMFFYRTSKHEAMA